MQPFSQEQAERFVDHLAECHSWYKHIPLLDGSEFIIVVDPDAGRNYSEVHPRLPFGNTKEGYQKAFGLLNYYSGYDNEYSSDCNDSMETAGDEVFSFEEIAGRFPLYQRIRLFPYVGGAFTDVFSCWSDALDKIVQGHEHEKRDNLIRLGYAVLREQYYAQFEMPGQQMVPGFEHLVEKTDRLTPDEKKRYKKYYQLREMIRSINGELRDGEIEKIRQAVKKLQKMSEK